MDPASDEVPPSERPSTAPGCAGLATRGPAIRRKRFYLIRHGQSMNNAVSLNDQAPTDDVSASPRPAALEPLGPSTAAGECAAGRRPAPSASPAPGSPPSEESFGPCGAADDDATRRIRATGRAPDPPLTALGKTQAAEAARWVQALIRQARQRPFSRGRKPGAADAPAPEVAKIVCSPMRRAVETAAEINKVFNVDVYVHPLLFEQGGLFHGPRKFPVGSGPLPSHGAGAGASTAASCASAAPAPSLESAMEEARTHSHSNCTASSGSSEGNEDVLSEEPNPSWRRMQPGHSEARHGLGMTLEEILQILPKAKVIEVPPSPRSALSGRAVDAEAAPGGKDVGAATGVPHSGKAHTVQAREADAIGGEYSATWPEERPSRWWRGGRETLAQTVQRARQVILWMEEECLQESETGGCILMVMHGLMMDLLLKALLFPFPSPDVYPSPYLEMLLDCLRHQERLTGVPIYNLPQQAAYFPSSNCSFCCLDLAARPVCLGAPEQVLSREGTCCVNAGSPQLVVPLRSFSRKEERAAQGEGHEPSGCSRTSEDSSGDGTPASRTPDAADTKSVPLSFRTHHAPRLVAALVQWNAQAVEAEHYTGHTLGASVLMSV